MNNSNIIQKRICISLCKDFNKVELETVLDPNTTDEDYQTLKQEMVEEARKTLYVITNPPRPSKKEGEDNGGDAPASDKQVEWLINLGVDPAEAQWYSSAKASAYIRKHMNDIKKKR